MNPEHPEPAEVLETQADKLRGQVEDYVRKNPGTALLVSASLGMFAVALVRSLIPPPSPRSALARLVDDLQQQISEATSPLYDRASGLAHAGSKAVNRGMDSLHDLHLDRKLDRWTSGLRSLFH